jgi:hypothetical protein
MPCISKKKEEDDANKQMNESLGNFSHITEEQEDNRTRYFILKSISTELKPTCII